MPLYTYRCKQGHPHDALGAVSAPSPRSCPECGNDAERLSIYKIAQVGEARIPPDERAVDLREFKEAGAELEYAHNKAQNSAGRELPTSSLWNNSKREANRLQKKGVKDSSDFRGTADGELRHRSRWLGTRLAGDTKD